MDARHPNCAEEIAGKIQSTLISNTLTRAQWEQHITDCLAYRFHAAMVPGAWVKDTAERLRNSAIKVASFIDLPFGTMTSEGKADEARRLVEHGAQELDLMPNIGLLLSEMEKEFAAEIAGVVRASGQAPVKVMLELPLLNAAQRQRAVALSIEAGVTFLKNASSGAVGVASPEDIRFLRRLAPPHIRIKASGGIKKLQQVRNLLDAGADLVGTSSAVAIMRELQGQPSTLHSKALY